MDGQVLQLEAVIQKVQGIDHTQGLIAELMPHFREQGLDLKGFHMDPLVASIAPKGLILKKALSVFKNIRWSSGRTGDVSFFPCKMTIHGMPFFGFIFIDHSATPNSQVVSIIAPPIPVLEIGTRILLEMDSTRAVAA